MSQGIRYVPALLAMVFFGSVSQAQVTFITSVNQLQVNGTVTWGALGFNGQDFGSPQDTILPGIPNTSLTVTGPDQTFGGFTRRDQGAGWNGSFNRGEELIWSERDGSFRIDFWNTQTGAPAPIAGFGARYEDASVGPYTGRLRGYDFLDNMLFTYELSGVGVMNGTPGSAPFFGALSTERNISYIYYDDLRLAGLGQSPGFALGTLYVQANAFSPVPEPASMLLVASVTLGALATARWKWKAAGVQPASPGVVNSALGEPGLQGTRAHC